MTLPTLGQVLLGTESLALLLLAAVTRSRQPDAHPGGAVTLMHGHGAQPVGVQEFRNRRRSWLSQVCLTEIFTSSRVYGQSWILIRAKARLTKPA